jgi:hypothetical protein
MVRYIPTLGFCWMLLWVSTACAPRHHKPEALSEHGYRVSLHVSDTRIFLGASGLNVPQASAVVVRVRDAQGQPVEGPCTCTMRINTTGSLGRPSQSHKGLDERALMASQRPSHPG